MTIFDPQSFVDAQTTQAATKRPPLPAGQDFVGVIGEVKSRTWQKEDKSGLIFDVPVSFDLSALNLGDAYKGINQITLVDAVFVDMTADQTGLDWSPGRNRKLGAYRKALDMNEDGKPFSARQMQGRQIRAKISHREYQGEKYDQIEAVAKA